VRPLSVLRLAPHFHRPGDWPVAYDPVGGMQNQVWRATRDLDAAGVRQTVVTTFIPGCERSCRPFAATTLDSVGFELPERLAPWTLSASWVACLLPRLAARVRAHDLVHVHLDHSIWCRLLALAAKRAARPLVVTLNVSLLSDGAATGWEGTVARLEARTLRAADRIVALTQRQGDAVGARVSGTAARIRVVPDAVDPSQFAAPPPADAVAAFRARHRIPDGRRVVAYVGRISDEKGWRDLPVVAARLARDGAFLLVCGDGPRRAGLEALLDPRARGMDWTITGFVSCDGVRAALALAEVVLLPSRREAFGSVLLEAMAAGVPAVAYAVGGIVDVEGGSGAIVLVPPQDTGRFAAAVGELLRDPASREACVRAGRARVRAFAAADVRDRMLALYREVVSG
jgi:glycosyltransferase involved in cell wall biosynthesis